MRFLLILFLTISTLAADPVDIASRYIGERETQGFNRSPFIDRINALAGVDMGSPYCASFVSFVMREAGLKNAPYSAWSPDWFKNPKYLVKFSDVQRNDIGGLYFSNKGRIAHVFIVAEKGKAFTKTIEANTSPDSGDLSAKSREGDGIFKRYRPNKLLEQPRNKFSRF